MYVLYFSWILIMLYFPIKWSLNLAFIGYDQHDCISIMMYHQQLTLCSKFSVFKKCSDLWPSLLKMQVCQNNDPVQYNPSQILLSLLQFSMFCLDKLRSVKVAADCLSSFSSLPSLLTSYQVDQNFQRGSSPIRQYCSSHFRLQTLDPPHHHCVTIRRIFKTVDGLKGSN